MPNKMLIDAAHPEETRVVVLRGNRVEEFDFESANRKQLRGNIYLAKVTRVEPSLQAAFVDYGGNRHGFLAFSEIHPDYYQIPIADRQALIAEEERAQREAEVDAELRGRGRHRHRGADRQRDRDIVQFEGLAEHASPEDAEVSPGEAALGGLPPAETADMAEPMSEPDAPSPEQLESQEAPREAAEGPADETTTNQPIAEIAPTQVPKNEPSEAADFSESGENHGETGDHLAVAAETADEMAAPAEPDESTNGGSEEPREEEAVESVGGADALEEVQERVPRFRRQYKIQEVIKRRQVMLVQVVKEERGTKGAALTTYLSLAGRYSVLMPNTARGGGISRKITSAEDRSRLKEIAQELEVPPGMGVILRTAGASRTKMEVKRDFEYLLRLWETVRDLTLKSVAPKLVYEEGSMVKRSIRDLYSKDIDEIIVAGELCFEEARDFMHMLMPSHVKHVKLYRDSQPLFTRYGIESQLDAMFSPVVQLRSGGYIVINQAEALVAIDVNSGRATREHHIEDTALKTNVEAAEEIARQLRLRDLAGLIVIDFIDMDEGRNNRTVERRLKECLRHDRARIQVGRISHFGLLEMSRQRIRTSVLESSTEKCPVCGGSGHVRSVSSVALQVLRALEDQLIRGATHNLIARTRPDVALYVLNQKRAHLRGLEDRFAITITITADETVRAPQTFVIDRGEQVHTPEAAKAIAERAQAPVAPLEDEDDLEQAGAAGSGADEADFQSDVGTELGEPLPVEHGEGGSRRRRRRRRRGRGGGEHMQSQPQHHHVEHIPIVESSDELNAEDQNATGEESPADDTVGFAPEAHSERQEPRRDDRRRRRGRRGGRRNRQRNGDSGYSGSDQWIEHAERDVAQSEPLTEQAGAESELTHAVADLDSQPTERAAPPEASATPAEQPEPGRRRSTVREPAPGAGVATTAPDNTPPGASSPAEPVVTETGETSKGERPRRTGWWSRRFAGG